MKTRILFIGLALTAFIVAGNAQSTTDNTSAKKAKTSFVDNNKDGVCDNYVVQATNGQGKAYRNGNGQCLRNGNGNRYGVKRGNRRGKGQGIRNGKGNGQGQFIDANKNGICDNKE